jgi:uncharacterized membrane protein YgaE (UPF0421/DUF939 family)
LQNDERKYLQHLDEMLKKGEEDESNAMLIKLRGQLETKNALSKQIDSKYQNFKSKKDEDIEYAERIKKKVRPVFLMLTRLNNMKRLKE